MRLGLTSPILTRVPGAFNRWEAGAGIAELGDIAVAADELGFGHLSCSEHVAVPVEVAEQRGGTYWDPLATFGFLAARTRRIRFLTQVLVLGYHHPLAIAKRYGTLDAVSGGRLTLGVGVGSLREEFELLGARFDGRGEIADDAMRALRAALSQPVPEYHGSHYDFAGMYIEPHAVQDRVPLWVGGRTRRSLRRACELGDGWVPFGLSWDALGELLAGAELPDGFDVVLSAGPLDPVRQPEEAARKLARAREAGATVVCASIIADSADDYLAALPGLAEIAGLEV